MIQALRTVLPIQEKIKAKEKKYICLDISEEAGTQLLKELEQTRFKARTRLLRELLEKKDWIIHMRRKNWGQLLLL